MDYAINEQEGDLVIETAETLESKSLWYKYKDLVWPREGEDTPVSGESASIHNIMRTLRGVRGLNELAYFSVPITSGQYMYRLKAKGRKIDMRDVIHYNYRLGKQYLNMLEQELNIPILFPADFIPSIEQWEQAHFQALWLNIISELCTEMHMCEGWEFSNGGTEEFVHAMQLKLGIPRHPGLIFYNTKNHEHEERERMKNIDVYDARTNKIMTVHDGIQKIEDALFWLRERNLEAPKLQNSLELLYWTRDRISEGFYQ